MCLDCFIASHSFILAAVLCTTLLTLRFCFTLCVPPSRVQAGFQFCIRHYAGEVEYTTEGFIEKNRDAIHKEVLELMATSRYVCALMLGNCVDACTPVCHGRAR